MTSEICDPVALAEELAAAEAAGRSIGLPSTRFADFDFTTARAVARHRDALRHADGDTMIGYKLGFTSAAMREAMGIERPNWGTLWRSHEVTGAGDLVRMVKPKVEPELVFTSAADLSALDGDVIADDVIEAAAGWQLGLELVDPRFPTFAVDWLDNTCDNSSAAGVVLGDLHTDVGDPGAIEVSFTDGVDEHAGRSDAALGSPALAVAWLVNQLAAEGEYLHAGSIVFTGGLTAPFDITADRHYVLTAPGFAPATLRT